VLNNIGVALLARQAYPQAMSTLKDAIFVMRNGLRSQGGGGGGGDVDASFSCAAEERVNKAAKFLASHTRPCSVSPVSTIRFEGGCVDLPATLPCNLEDYLSSVILNPVHIEIADFECLDDRDTDLDSALMLYNFGLAHAAMAGQQDHSPATALKLRMGTLSLLDMAKTIIMDDRCMNYKCLEDMDAIKQNRLQLSFVIESARVRMLLDLGELTAASEIMDHLTTLEGAIGEMMDSTAGGTEATLCVAAAAA
jgi:hypothetical protein